MAQDLKRRNVKFKYEEDRITYVEPAKTRTYTPDLKIGESLIVEIKGRWTAADRRKMGLVIEQNPGMDIRILFDRDHTITKTSNTRYSDWCKKRGIPFAIGQAVPQEWLDE